MHSFCVMMRNTAFSPVLAGILFRIVLMGVAGNTEQPPVIANARTMRFRWHDLNGRSGKWRRRFPARIMQQMRMLTAQR